MATDKKLITLKPLNKSNVWELQENDVFRIWSAGEKDADMTENINRYITILRSAFEIEEVKVDRPEVIRLFLGMAVSMTLIEYIGGLMLLKGAKIRLWDYSNCRGNVQGLICPLFSFFWALLGAGYYFLIHPHILTALAWLSENLAFSFVIGFFFGVFLVDMASNAHWAARIKAFADENGVIVKVENLKAHIRSAQERASARVHFFFAFRSERPLAEHLREAHEAVEKIRQKRKNDAA